MIRKSDKNFVLKPVCREDYVLLDPEGPPFEVRGIFRDAESGLLCRMPPGTAACVNPGTASLCTHTAGGRIVFRTDSPRLAVFAELMDQEFMPHFSLTGSMGFDLYIRRLRAEGSAMGSAEGNVGGRAEGIAKDSPAGGGGFPEEGADGETSFPKEKPAGETGFVYAGTFVPPAELIEERRTGYSAEIDLRTAQALGGSFLPGEYEALIHMPLYAGIRSLRIGIAPGSAARKSSPYRPLPPIVYYGSSITQGACASRPGNAYPAILSRWNGIDFVDLGFSGNARGEMEMAAYIAGLGMSAFVMDYDRNAPSSGHLWKTHRSFYRRIRAAHPDMPIIFMSRQKSRLTPDEEECYRAVRAAFEEEQEKGKKSAFLDGRTVFEGECAEAATVDGCHPNDLGFFLMAEKLKPIFAEMGLGPLECGR